MHSYTLRMSSKQMKVEDKACIQLQEAQNNSVLKKKIFALILKPFLKQA